MAVDGNDRAVQLHKSPEKKARDNALAIGLRYFKFRSRIAYSQSRPTQLRWPKFTTKLDCSGLVAACMHHAKVMPNVDWRWTNTWIQIKMGRPVTLTQAKPGDIVFYGTSPSNPTHEALMLGTLEQLQARIKVPADVARLMRGRGKCVLTNGHYPMSIEPVDYRSDRVAIRAVIGPGPRA